MLNHNCCENLPMPHCFWWKLWILFIYYLFINYYYYLPSKLQLLEWSVTPTFLPLVKDVAAFNFDKDSLPPTPQWHAVNIDRDAFILFFFLFFHSFYQNDLGFDSFLQHKKFIESFSFFLSKYLKTKTKDKRQTNECWSCKWIGLQTFDNEINDLQVVFFFFLWEFGFSIPNFNNLNSINFTLTFV